MKKHHQSLAAFVAIISTIVIGLPSESRAQQTFCGLSRKDPRILAAERVSVRIRDQYVDGTSSAGSGIVIGPRVVLTNAHVALQRSVSRYDPFAKKLVTTPVARVMKVCLQTEPKETCFPATIIVMNEADDLALIGTEVDLPAAAQFSVKEPEKYDCVFVDTSIAKLLGPTIVTGPYLGRADLESDPKRRWVLDVAINPGGSGGPVFDGQTGAFVSIIEAVTSYGGRSMAVSVPNGAIRRFLEDAVKTRILSAETIVK